MMIGAFSQIPYRTFAAAIAPISAFGLILTIVLIAALYRREFIDVSRIDIEKPHVRVNTALLWKSVAAAGVMIFFFSWDCPSPRSR
jgi:Na+/H+ antiporter NhaD/arsenite permease-like protein